MKEEKGEDTSILESPETITRRIEGHIIRGALDEERRARKALILLRARDRRIAMLEKKVASLENCAGGDTRLLDFSCEDTSVDSSIRETTYLTVSCTERSDSRRFSGEMTFDKKDEKIDKNQNNEKISIGKELDELISLKFPATTSSDAVASKNTSLNFNENSSLSNSDEFRDESSVDLVVTAALAFSKFDDDQWRSNDRAKVCVEGRELNDPEENKKCFTLNKSSRRNLVAQKMSTSFPGIKTRRRSSLRNRKLLIDEKIKRTSDDNSLNRNLRQVQAGLDELLGKSVKQPKVDSSKRNGQYGVASVVQKQKVEDKVVREDAQEAASIPDGISNNDDTDDLVMIAKKNDESNDNFLRRNKFSQIWNITDEPAPQWLIEEALKRGDRNSGIRELSNTEEHRNDSDDNLELNLDRENIIFDLEKELATTRTELAEALNEQSIIKDRYKKALRNLKIAADEERAELQRKLVQICTSILEKFGPDALSDKTVKIGNKKRHRPAQYFGTLSRKFHKKLRIATLTSSKLKQEVIALRKELNEKSQRYDCLVKCFDSLKIELKNRETNLNDLINENATLRKRVDDARDWMQMKVSKERNEKMNAFQFREIQRGRELASLKKKSEEDFSTIAQLRAKLLRSESANTNKGFLLNNYKSQLSDLTKDKEKLSAKIKELEMENTSLRNGNVQLRSNLTLINGEKEKLKMELDKSEIEMRERIQSKLVMKYERSMLEKIDAIRSNYEKSAEAFDTKLKLSENSISQYFGAIKRYFKEIHDYHRELDAERDLCSSEASEREAHETACEILNITRGELTGFLKGRTGNAINSWLSTVQRITAKKHFAEELGKFLFARAIGSATN